MWRDQVRMYRYERQLKCVEKAERMAKKAGFTPQAVPLKILFPLLEGASFEEDENLHTMWAALLANAASPDNADKVRPGFIGALKQMSPDEARLLRSVSEPDSDATLDKSISSSTVTVAKINIPPIPSDPESQAYKFYQRTIISLEGLIAQNLVSTVQWQRQPDGTICPTPLAMFDLGGTFTVTERGHAFIKACQPPQPKS